MEEMTPKQVKNYLKGESKKILLDVRTALEHKTLRISESINLDIYDELFEEKLEKLDKEPVYIVYCKTGGRSKMATQFLREAGFAAVNLKGGIESWIDNNLEVEEY